MKNTDFLSVSSYIRVQEKRVLNGSALDRVVEAETMEDALHMLTQNSDYDFNLLERVEDYEESVRAEQRRVFKMVYDLCKAFPSVVEVIGCKYDYHNVKVAIRANYLDQRYGAPYIEATPVAPEAIVRVVEKFDTKANLPKHILQAVRVGKAAFAEHENPQDLDISLDKEMYAYMLEQAKQTESKLIIGYVQQLIDFYNFKTLVRVKSMEKGSSFLARALIPGGKTDMDLFKTSYSKTINALVASFVYKDYGAVVKAGMEVFERERKYAELEKLVDNYMLEYLQAAKRIPFGPEVPFAYLLAKENELRQVRILLACKQNQIPAEILKERLRDNYV